MISLVALACQRQIFPVTATNKTFPFKHQTGQDMMLAKRLWGKNKRGKGNKLNHAKGKKRQMSTFLYGSVYLDKSEGKSRLK